MVSAHPAGRWAEAQDFDTTHIDCTTAVVLKVLDGKCKMAAVEQAAILAIYDAVGRVTARFDAACHAAIDAARRTADAWPPGLDARIHALRVQAEAVIPKPVMKNYKAFLRESLFGA